MKSICRHPIYILSENPSISKPIIIIPTAAKYRRTATRNYVVAAAQNTRMISARRYGIELAAAYGPKSSGNSRRVYTVVSPAAYKSKIPVPAGSPFSGTRRQSEP